jgi:glycosyltransferase involved in cell wall biosynthesis
MRILHVVCTDAFAGVERHVALLAAAQHDAGHEVRVIGGNGQRMAAEMNRPGISSQSARTTWRGLQAINSAPPPDVINVHMTSAEVAAALAVRVRSTPIVSTRHFAAHRGSTALRRTVAMLAARSVAAQIAVSDYVAHHIDGRSVVVHSGVRGADGRRPAADRDRVVLVAQRLEREKRTDVALRAFARSGLSELGWRLEIAGEGAERRSLERLSKQLGLADNVAFLGHRSDVDELMDTASILFASRPDEAYGLSVLEAMATGLPVVATGAGGHVETVGSVEGAALFDPGDAAAAGRLLAELAEDAARRDTYGKALQETQRTRFTLEAQVKATHAVYRSVM